MAANKVMGEVGRYTYGHDNIQIFTWGEEGAGIKVGAFCSISQNCNIFLGGNHRTDWVTTFPFGHAYKEVFHNFDGHGHPTSKGDVIIGNDVWIATSVTIMSGVTIGDGAVIAANSHVVKDVEPYSIVGGNPARHLKYRFSPEQIEGLLKLKWWYWPVSRINNNAHLLCSDRIDELLEKE